MGAVEYNCPHCDEFVIDYDTFSDLYDLKPATTECKKCKGKIELHP